MFQIKVVEKIKTHHFVFSIFFFFLEIRAVYDIMWGGGGKFGTAEKTKEEVI